MTRFFALTVLVFLVPIVWQTKKAIDKTNAFLEQIRLVEVIPPSTKPSVSQESIDAAVVMFNIDIPNTTLYPQLDLTLEDRGRTQLDTYGHKSSVTIGPPAFESWALLGSTLAHELEIHCNQNFALIGIEENLGFDAIGDAERQAYTYEIRQQKRFHLTDKEIITIYDTMVYWYPVK